VTVGGDRWHGHDCPTSLESALPQLISDLRRDGVSFALVGGSLSVRTEPRLTRDADVAVSVADDTEAEAVVYRLVERGYRAGAPLEQYVAGRPATARRAHRDRPDVVVDLLFASCGIEPEIVGSAEEIEVLADRRLLTGTMRYAQRQQGTLSRLRSSRTMVATEGRRDLRVRAAVDVFTRTRLLLNIASSNRREGHR
jgi:hypothetical protein